MFATLLRANFYIITCFIMFVKQLFYFLYFSSCISQQQLLYNNMLIFNGQ